MNIIEAIKSGKRFRREGEDTWIENDESYLLTLYPSSLLADDWEVEEKKVTITESEFDNNIKTIFNKWEASRLEDIPKHVRDAFADLKKELGL